MKIKAKDVNISIAEELAAFINEAIKNLS